MDSMNHKNGTESSLDGSLPSGKKPYSSPKLTHFGQMSQLTQLGEGDGENDGDDEYGRPLS